MKSAIFQRFMVIATLVSTLAAVPFLARAAEREETIPGRPEITTRTLIVAPAGEPRAATVLFVGGNGDLSAMKGNFLMRIRQRLADAGLLLALPDAPSDRSGRNNLTGNFRASRDHAADIQGVVQYLKKQRDMPVFVIGTSRGSTSAANAAARLGPGLIAGVALTSSVTRKGLQGQISVYEAPIENIRQPAFVMWHDEDACSETTPDDAAKLAPALKASPKVTVKTLTGGLPPKSGPCDAISPHGFYGIEERAAAEILTWIDEVLATAAKP